MGDILHQFQSFVKNHNLEIENPKFDGGYQRFDGLKPNSGWYIGSILEGSRGFEFLVVTVGDWIDDKKLTFHSEGKFSRQDRALIKYIFSQALEKATLAKRKTQTEVAKIASQMWDEATNAVSHPYLSSKKIDACGSKLLNETLIVRCQDIHNQTLGVQFIETDGKKRFLSGQKVKGTFYVISKLDADIKNAFLCEGYSTGASIYMAFGKPVICCFSASNLVEVAKQIRSKFPKLELTVCADDDVFNEKNVGRTFGKKAAAVFMSHALFPNFKDASSKPTDFNDLHCLEGLDEVKRQLQAPRVSDGYRPLGMLGSTHYFLLKATNQIFRMSNFTSEQMFVLRRKEQLAALYPGNNGSINWDEAKSAIVQQSINVGSLNLDRIRGIGVWLDSNRTVVNTGSFLIIDGEKQPLSEINSSYTYISSKNQFSANAEPLPTKESKKLVDVLTLFNWQRNADPLLLGGWIALARIAGSLSHRPHVFITGAKGTGKSTLIQEVVNPALGKAAFEALGGTTAAGIRQSIGADSIPVVYDEFETGDEENRNNKQLMDLFRQSWSASDSKIFKGTPEGMAFNYAPLFPVLLGGIRPHFFNDADRSRFSVLELHCHDSDQEYKKKMDRAISKIDKLFGERLFARSVSLIDTIRVNAKVIVGTLAGKTSQRFAHQAGLLLAGYYSLISEGEVTEKDASELIDSLDLSLEAYETAEEDHYQCLDHLLTTKIQYRIEGKTEEDTIWHLANSRNKDLHESLEKIGIKVLEDKLAIAYRHTELSKLFQHTRWKTWATSLKRVKGSTVSNLRIETKQTKCVCIPMGDTPIKDPPPPSPRPPKKSNEDLTKMNVLTLSVEGKDVPCSWWDGRENIGEVFSFDTETTLIEPGKIPDFVLGSAFNGSKLVFFTADRLKDFVEIHKNSKWIAHNAAFDLSLIEKELGRKQVFDWIENRQVLDSFILAKLVHLGIDGNPDKKTRGTRSIPKFSLDAMLSKLFNVKLSKTEEFDGEPIRLSYGKYIDDVRSIPEPYLHYNALDTIYTFLLWEELESQAKEVSNAENVDETLLLSHFTEVEKSWAANLTSRLGMRVDLKAFEEVKEEVEEKLTSVSLELKEKFGYYKGTGEKDRFEKALKDVEETFGIKFPIKYNKTSKCERFDCDQTSLKQFSYVPFIEKYLEYKKLQKIHSTFLVGIEKFLVDGILYPRIHTVLDTGRISFSKPNLQQIPRPSDGRDLRRFFIPTKANHIMLGIDFSAAELVTLADRCVREFGYSKLGDAINQGLDVHKLTANLVTGKPYDEVTKEDRQLAKAVNFGFPGGLGISKFIEYAKDSYGVVITEEQAEFYKRGWLDAYPELREYLNLANMQVENRAILTVPRGLTRKQAVYALKDILAGETVSRFGTEYSQSLIEWAWENTKGLLEKYPIVFEQFNKKILYKISSKGLSSKIDYLRFATLPSGRIRAQCTYNNFNNNAFQGTQSDISGRAWFNLWKEGFEVCHMVHDEVQILVPDNEQDKEKYKKRAEEILLEAAKFYCPNVKMGLESEFNPHWKK